MSPATRYSTTDDDWTPATGRHAFDEDAELTPIFHALTRGGWRRRQHEPAAPAVRPAQAAPPPPPRPDPVDAFRRDPLTAPIPVQALTPAPSIPNSRVSGTGAHVAVPAARHELIDEGRHHHRREAYSSRW
ncbi:hypothetical protein [Pseudonocardia xinjiangensis]|uniref:Uncharacterized protein n=1 Tax=Pseudonocardia xinjiangensis TaxID=75289 RepID=A0ABX1RQD1_9PSEU|nr:hypothetical protein [Pseudonocardia xinjiangensis]NMH81854.1 hypothetical protein [Pseudonocardia xinjiangensis]